MRQPTTTAEFAEGLSEAEFQRQVTQLADALGWSLQYHTHDSRRSQPGFPDLVLVHPGQRRLIYAELKAARGAVSDAQWAWHMALRGAGQEAYIWRPADWPDIERALRGPQ